MIEIIKGVYGHRVGVTIIPVRPGDKPISLTSAQESRLVNLGVARYCNSSEVVETANDPNESESTVLTGHLDKEQLESMSYNDLKKLAAELGANSNGKKTEIIESILAVEVETDATEAADEEPPTLIAADPE